MTQESQPFNTAVFYDIENLLRGYNFSQQFAADLSLKEILGDIATTNLIGRIAVQRAYANWSDPRLGILRNEINELGIDPVQVFGFSRDARKNAADIQLAIDAIDLAHTRPAIDTFVVVSGDGGFAALAKKLHEYGRSVIGCAYRNATNQTFHAVCDAFVWIEPPDDDEEEMPQRFERAPRPNHGNGVASGDSFSGSALQDEVIAKLGRLKAGCERDRIETAVRKLLEIIASAPTFHRQMEREGVPLTVYGQVLRECIPAFDPTQLGFPKLTELLRHFCTGTPWQVGRRLSDGILRVFPRKVLAGTDGLQALDDLHEKDMHGESFYRILLRQGEPTLRLAAPAEFHAILERICSQRPDSAGLGEIIENCAESLQGSVPAESVKQTVLTLVAGAIFTRTPPDALLTEQKLTLREEFIQPRVVVEHIRSQAQTKIVKLLGRVDEDTLAAIL
jgi:uncharacterized LabA/DUF88 family protein